MRRAWLAAALTVASVGSARADWTVKRDPFDATVVARYKAILARDPYDAGALAALKNLYGRYRTIAALESELGTDWPGRVVRARLHPDAEHWRAVIEVREDARALFELALYERALAATTDVDLQRRCLEHLMADAANHRDHDRLDALFARLSALMPNRPKLWLDRAQTLVTLRRHAEAVDAYAHAEKLLANDPEWQAEATFARAQELLVISEFDAAIAAFETVIARLPSGHYLADDARVELVTAHERRGTLPDYLAQIRKQFPHPGYKQWKLLATIHETLGEEDEAFFALKHAVAAAPSEIDTQREVIERLDSAGDHAAALAQLEAATRAIPGDFALHLDLAMRYRDAKDTAKATDVLRRISARLANDAGVHERLVSLFTEWNRPGLVLHEREELARLEPDTDHLADLGDTYWATGHEDKAVKTWGRITDPLRLGQIYLDHDLPADAYAVYTRAIKKDARRADLWRARSELQLGLAHWNDAEADARKAVELVHGKPMDVAHDVRYQLVRVLAQSAEREVWDDTSRLERAVTEWQRAFFALEPDIDAGYMLAELLGRNAPSEELLRVLVEMRKLAPNDPGVVTALVRAYKVLHRYDDALAELRTLEKQNPTRKDIAEQIADVEARKKDLSWRREGIEDPEGEIYARFHRERVSELRGGVRIGLGTGLRGPAEQSMTIGLFLARRIAPHVAFVGRLDWTERTGEMDAFSAVALSTGIAVPLGGTQNTTFFLGAAHRTELRYGDHPGWDTIGLAGDVTLEVVPSKVSASFGLRFEQGVSDHGQGTAVLLELTASSGT